MEQQLALEGGGTLRLWEEGPRVRLEARRGDDGRGLYKVWLRGRGEGRTLLGTLAPEHGELALARTLSLRTLEAAECWPVAGASCVLTYSFAGPEAPAWVWEQAPWTLLTDPVLAQAAKRWGALLLRKTESGFFLSAPFRTDQEFPLPPLFCLGTVEQVNGRPHMIFQFDKNGMPVLPHRTQPGGTH